MITKLQKEDHTGYVEVTFSTANQKGYIFLLAGRVIEALLILRGEETSGAAVPNRILEMTKTSGAVFSVYRSAVEEALSESEMIKVSFNLPQLLEVWGAVIQAVEKTADNMLGDEEFLNTFKDTLIEKADDYPFLDPFAAKFQYKAGQVTFSGEISKNFSQSIAECLWATVETLAERVALDGEDLFAPVRSALDDVNENYGDLIDRFNFAGLLPDLFV